MFLGRKHRTPARWRDACDPLKASYFHKALETIGPVHAFTANLSKEIEAEALSQKNPIDWLRRRISRNLRLALGRGVDFWIVAEEADDRRFHLHGELGIADTEAKNARGAIRKACGLWENTRQHQVHTKPDPDSGWTEYVIKDAYKASGIARQRFGNTSQSVRFHGGVITRTQKLGAAAENLYAKDRETFFRENGKLTHSERAISLMNAAPA